MKKVFLFLLILINTTFADEVSNETEFTKGYNKSDKCNIECPIFKDGFFGRFANFNIETGETTCFVYSNNNPMKSLATVINKNPNCSNILVNPNSVVVENSSTRAEAHLKQISADVSSQYINGGMSSYINLPKYMVAGLMADDKIIDISSSISTNRVVLNGGYTNEVNLNYSSDGIDVEMLSRAKSGLANSITFVMNFLNSSDKILLSFKVSLFLFVVAMTVILIVTQKSTKKLSQMNDQEDVTEKIVFGVLSILIFFLSVNKIQTNNGQISQTAYQQIVRPLFYMGIGTADKLTETATSSFLKYKLGNVGIVASDDLRSLNDLRHATNQKYTIYKGLFESECLSRYNTDEFKFFTSAVATNYKFPQSEYIKATSNSVLNDSSVNFYTQKFMKNYDADLRKTNTPSVSFCFKLEKAKTELKAQLDDIDSKLRKINGNVDSLVFKNTSKLTELVYKNIAEFGFMGIGNIAVSSLAFDNFSLIKNDANENEIDEQKTKHIREVNDYEVSSIADGEGFVGGQMNELITQAPLFMLPFANDIKGYVDSVLNPVKSTESTDGIAKKIIKSFTGKNWVVQLLSVVANIATTYIATVLTMWILSSILLIAPMVAMITASFLVICFYFLSVEILYIAVPFASIFAFSTGNLEILKSLIKNTFILAVKPVLIVVSCVMALFVYEMFINLNQVLTDSMIEPLFALANNTAENSSFFSGVKYIALGDSGVFLLIKSTMQVGASVITTLTCFYLVFNGANLILDILGMRDGGFDVGNTIGSSVGTSSTGSKMAHGGM